MTTSSRDIFLPMSNLNLIFTVIKSYHFDWIITKNCEFIAENSLNIIWGRNENERPFSWVPFEEQSWNFITEITWFFVFFMILDQKFSLNISQNWWFQELTCLLDQSLKIVTCIFFISSWIFFQLFLLRSFIPAYVETYFPSFVFFRSLLP